jgi:hypothetical protein
MRSSFTRTLFVFLSSLFLGQLIMAQPGIEWQQSIGTVNSDNALQLFKDPAGDLIVIGTEPHQDFTGNYRDYLAVVKLDTDGNPLWKSYTISHLNYSIHPLDYSIGAHFFTEEWGEHLLNLVVTINNQVYLIKLLENNGAFFTYEQIASPLIDVRPNNDKVYAVIQCSYSAACYGPDSLTVQQFDPTPDSIIFNPIKWTFGLKQNIRTAPLQGHYDFDGQDIREDSLGNVYLLVQIERWDFQFCTDCNDAFIDAWCEVFKFSPEGELLKHQRLVTSRAVVSAMSFVSFDEGEMIVRVDDINAANTALITSLYHVDADLKVTKTVKLDRQYVYVAADVDGSLLTCTNIYDQNNPDIHGEADVLVSKFNVDGVLQWKKILGGSSWEWPRGLVQSGDDVVFLSNTQSTDFDIAQNNGGQDMWVVKLSEQASATDHLTKAGALEIYPNPSFGELHIDNAEEIHHLELSDLNGRVDPGDQCQSIPHRFECGRSFRWYLCFEGVG